jgi:hypothetical protein
MLGHDGLLARRQVMATKNRPGKYRELSGVAKHILQDVRTDFTAKGLSANALAGQYAGVSIISLQQKYCGGAETTQVDFDLALKELEDALLISTGPMVPFDNRPGSGVFVMGLFSKREHVCITEAGYRAAAQMDSQNPRRSPPHVHISGGTFHQSQIGIGDQVKQVQKIDIENDAQLVEHLTELLLSSGVPVDGASKAEIARLVQVTRQGDIKEAKPIFQKLFGLASETVKQAAWGILTAIITKALGM